jgi:hypothetical protein
MVAPVFVTAAVGLGDWAAARGEMAPMSERVAAAKGKREERELFMMRSPIEYMNVYQM